MKKWYYDACSLDVADVMQEIINLHRYNTEAVTSHLALGEAFGNCRMKGEDALDNFNELLKNIGEGLHVVGNDGTHDLYCKVRGDFPRLSETDALHLATAIKKGCNQLHTLDRDLGGLPKEEIRKFAEQNGCSEFCIKLHELRSSKPKHKKYGIKKR